MKRCLAGLKVGHHPESLHICAPVRHSQRADANVALQANVWTGQSSSTPVVNYNSATPDEMMLSLWGILTFCFFVQTLRINRGLQTLFISLTVLFFLLAGGVKNPICNKVLLSHALLLAPASLLCWSACAPLVGCSGHVQATPTCADAHMKADGVL